MNIARCFYCIISLSEGNSSPPPSCHVQSFIRQSCTCCSASSVTLAICRHFIILRPFAFMPVLLFTLPSTHSHPHLSFRELGGSLLRSDSYKLLIGPRNMIAIEGGGRSAENGEGARDTFSCK